MTRCMHQTAAPVGDFPRPISLHYRTCASYKRDMPDSSPQSPENHPQTPAATPESAPQASPSAVDPGPRATPLPAKLEPLAETARDYARAATSENTNRAYAADWRHYCAWARRQNLEPLPPNPQVLGLYIAACASGAAGPAACSVRTIERRLSALAWNFAQRGEKFDRKDRHVATVLAGIRRTQGRPPEQKEAVLPGDLIAMIGTLDLGDLRGLRDRAILLLGFAGGLRRSEIVGLDCGPEDTSDGAGWIERFDEGVLLTLRGKTGWREVEIGRGSSDATCPVVALETWLKFGRIERGPLFRRVVGKSVGAERLADRHVARLVKQTAMAAGVRGDLSEGEREQKFSGHSLRAGLASSAEVDERYVQKQLGHASAEMTRRYQRRRDRFRVNLTKAAGL
jgi:integrase